MIHRSIISHLRSTMDIFLLKSPTEVTLEASDVDLIRDLASRRMNAGNKRPGTNPTAGLFQNTPNTTPIVQPIILPSLPPEQEAEMRRARRGGRNSN